MAYGEIENKLNPQGATIPKDYTLRELVLEAPLNTSYGKADNLDQRPKWTWGTLVKDLTTNPIALIDPLGIFHFIHGMGSLFRSTRHFHYFQQTTYELNNNFTVDPIQSYAMYAVNNGNNDISGYVRDSLKQGGYHKLIKYYQVSRVRYNNRNWNWKHYRTTNFKASKLKVNYSLLQSLLPNGSEIVMVSDEYTTSNQYYLNWVQKNYSLDSFRSEYLDKKWDIVDNVPTANQYKIAEEDDTDNEDNNSELIVPNSPQNLSKGITTWLSSKGEELIQTFDIGTTELRKDKRNVNISGLTKVGDSVTKLFVTVFKSPLQSEETTELNKAPDDGKTEGSTAPNGVPARFTFRYKVTLIDIETRNYQGIDYEYYKYQLEEQHYRLEYDTEKHYYLLEDGTTNLAGLDKVMELDLENIELNNNVSSEESKAFRFYPIIPLQEWGHNWNSDYYKYPVDNDELKNAIHTINDLSKKENKTLKLNDTHEDKTDSDIQGQRVQQKQQKNNERTEDNKTSERKLHRKLTTILNRRSKHKINHFKNYPKKKPSLKRHKRLIEQMTSYIGVNYWQHWEQLRTQDWFSGGDKSSIEQILMPAVMLTSDVEIVHHYWYEWAKRLYKLNGKERGVNEWISMVQSASSLESLPYKVLELNNDNEVNQFKCAYLYVHKIKIKGFTREIKRKPRVYEIKRGNTRNARNLEALKANPLCDDVLMNDSYYESKSGKQIPIGSDNYSGTVYLSENPQILKELQSYGYTLFCKSSGNGELTCYAVAGLTFMYKGANRKIWASAHYDLSMQYERNKEARVNGNRNANIKVETQYRKSKRTFVYNIVQHFGIMPIDYKVLTRMGTVNAERLSAHIMINYGRMWYYQKGKRKGTTRLMKWAPVIILVVTIILAIFCPPCAAVMAQIGMGSIGAGATASQIASFVVSQIVIAVAVNLAVQHILLPLFKMLGLKGLVAIILLLVIIIVAYMYGGGTGTDQAINIASETTGQVATQVGNEIAIETTKSAVQTTFLESLKTSLSTAFSNMTTTEGIAKQLLGVATDAYTDLQQDEMNQLQQMAQEETHKFNESMKELTELQETLDAQTSLLNYRYALEGLRDKLKAKAYEEVFAFGLDNEGLLPSYESVIGMLDSKLNLDVDYFDPIKSTDFTMFNKKHLGV